MSRIVILLFLAMTLIAGRASESHAAKRVALVIGNSGYTLISPLPNPKNDAELMAATLKDLGFEVHMVTDADRRAMGRAVRKFGKALRLAGKDAVGLFFYAGHGIQARGANYLVPLGAEIENTADLEVETLSASNVLAQMEEAGNALNLIILDACRNNPLQGRVRSAGRGLARINAASGSLIAFSAAPGQVAADGDGENSPYTTALAKAMRQPGLTVEQMFKRVRVQVEGETGGSQTPWEESSLRGDFYFAGKGTGSSSTTAPPFTTAPVSTRHAAQAWEAVKDIDNLAVFEAFLKEHPDGLYAALARARLERQKLAKLTPPEEVIAAKGRNENITVKLGKSTKSKKALLGVRISTVTDEWAKALGLKKARGALIMHVVPEGPADIAGIYPGDVVIGFDGRDIDEMRELPRRVGETPAGKEIKVVLWRIARNSSDFNSVLRDRADKGDVDAIYALSQVYLFGIGVTKDQSEVVRWYRKAAEKGYTKAMYSLGMSYSNGTGIGKDERESFYWIRKAAEKGYAEAMTILGMRYANGRGIGKDEREAARWYRKAVEKGNTDAMNNLGVRYQYGSGVNKDEREAVRLYRKAAETGQVYAMVNLGAMYQHGRGVAKDQSEAVRWYRKAAEKGYAKAMYSLGVSYSNGSGIGKDESEALNWIRKAAEKGYAKAMHSLGVRYANGTGVGKDEREAARWYRKAVDKGNADAMNNLGVSYQQGRGVNKDEREAVRLYRKAAEKGQVYAMQNLGYMYRYGRGVAKDQSEAVRWYRKAAEKGKTSAMFVLGANYRDGAGIQKDQREAVKWFFKAADNGNIEAYYSLAQAHEGGNGVAKDPKAAAGYMFKSLRGGYAFAVKEMTTNANAWNQQFRRELQRLMKQEGVYSGSIDGSFGPGTKRAVKTLAKK